MTWLRKWAKFLLLLLSGVLLCYISFRQLNPSSLWELLITGNYYIILPVYIISVSGYWFRTKRWQLMMGSMNYQVPARNLFASLCTGYLVNYAFPRLGELTRCALIKKTDDVPFDKTLLAIVAERTIDTLCLFLLLVPAFTIYSDRTYDFFYHHVIQPVYQKIGWKQLIAGIILLTSGVILIHFYIKRKSREQYLAGKLADWKESIRSIMNLKQRSLFLLYTLLIWSCYFLMTYLWMFTFAESTPLGLGPAFVVMVIGSIGRSVPIQGGGMGAYHFLVSQTLHMFGISLVTGNALALIIHGAQSVLTFFTGIMAYTWLIIQFNKRTLP